MKQITFKDGSWHYWLAHNPGGLYARDTDICTYTRKVLKGAWICLLVATLISLLIVALADWVAWVTAMLMQHALIDPGAGAMFASAILIIVGIGCLFEAGSRIHLPSPPPDSFVAESWRSLKEKTCFRVTIE